MAESAEDFEYLRRLVFRQSNNVLEPSRDYLFESRLKPFLMRKGIAGLEELVDCLRKEQDPFLERAVAEAMTINETSFFRDVRPFELLRTELIPKLIESRRETRTLRLWSAACSTGQEAVSLAITLCEHFPLLKGWNVRIEGTDLSAEVVERARAGRYQRIEINRGLPARFIVRYFDRAGEDWEVKREIREMCMFRQANLCASPLPFVERFDGILMRNVMLYFSRESRRALLDGVHRLLARDGFLMLGSTEQPVDRTRWTPVLAGGTSYYLPAIVDM